MTAPDLREIVGVPAAPSSIRSSSVAILTSRPRGDGRFRLGALRNIDLWTD